MGIAKRVGNLAKAYINFYIEDIKTKFNIKDRLDELYDFLDFEKEFEEELLNKDENLINAYKVLDIPYGSDLKTAKLAWKKLMKKYHPDFNCGNQDKERLANEISIKITSAYKEIEKYWQSKNK